MADIFFKGGVLFSAFPRWPLSYSIYSKTTFTSSSGGDVYQDVIVLFYDCYAEYVDDLYWYNITATEKELADLPSLVFTSNTD